MYKKILLKKMTIDNQPVKLELKSIPVQIKIVDATAGIIEAYVSVFGNVDSYGDVVVKGAFARAVSEFNANGGRYPKGVMHHDWSRPVAKTLEMREDDTGLYIKGKLVLGVQDAAEAYELIKEGVITDFSFGYSVRDYEYNVEENIRYIKDIEIFEWSPVLVGANNLATLIGVKSAGSEFEEVDKADVMETPEEVTPTGDEEVPAEDTPEPTIETPAPIETTTDAPEGTEDAPKSDETPSTETPPAETVPPEVPSETDKSAAAETEIKAGRVLSKENEQKVRDAIGAMNDMVASAKSTVKMFEELLSSLEQPTDGKSTDGQSARSSAADPNLLKGLRIAAKQAIKGGNAMIVHIKKIEGKK